MLRLLSVLMLALIVGPAAGARWLASTPSASQSVTDYILAQPDLQTFYAAIEAANAVGEENSNSRYDIPHALPRPAYATCPPPQV